MPFRWDTETGQAPDISGASFFAAGDPPLARLRLCAHSSLSAKGFVIVIATMFALALVPLLSVLGSPVFWPLLPFVMGALGLLWWALKHSWADKDIQEDLAIWTDRVTLRHSPARGPEKRWEANTYWTVAQMHPRRGGHRNYITLAGGGDGREVELGGFLDETERATLHPVLKRVLETAATSARPL
ncbi:DUF2244 domain-containing protein [Mangrovicoccus algicola]|uniref:DUF2244 domain-containing protein n=1 Tax=Mangrovicoccus algicola TaxID=2771008 RepID=A0A8J7CZ15_9RHOB|nr:DUF2244 domain-containing protein [Mangrovicoccus algicola]MBE3640272.1 DUF2244 domain-containing protein [Mangrovicoccus algicola]